MYTFTYSKLLKTTLYFRCSKICACFGSFAIAVQYISKNFLSLTKKREVRCTCEAHNPMTCVRDREYIE